MWRDSTLRLREREASHALFTWSLQVTCSPADTQTQILLFRLPLFYIFYISGHPQREILSYSLTSGEFLTQLVWAMMMNYPALVRQYISDGLSHSLHHGPQQGVSRVSVWKWDGDSAHANYTYCPSTPLSRHQRHSSVSLNDQKPHPFSISSAEH